MFMIVSYFCSPNTTRFCHILQFLSCCGEHGFCISGVYRHAIIIPTFNLIIYTTLKRPLWMIRKSTWKMKVIFKMQIHRINGRTQLSRSLGRKEGNNHQLHLYVSLTMFWWRPLKQVIFRISKWLLRFLFVCGTRPVWCWWAVSFQALVLQKIWLTKSVIAVTKWMLSLLRLDEQYEKSVLTITALTLSELCQYSSRDFSYLSLCPVFFPRDVSMWSVYLN